jgi:hypothetical protein
MLVVQVFCELRNAFRVGLGLELEALGLEQGLEFLVVCDDAIVYDGELPSGVRSARNIKSAWGLVSSVGMGVLGCNYRWGWQFSREGGP